MLPNIGLSGRTICLQPSQPYREQLRQRYNKASQQERGHILDEFVQTTGYHRKHASAWLRRKRDGRDAQQPIQRKRRRLYTDADKRAVCWWVEWFDQIGSKRLRVAMDNELATRWRPGHLRVSRACYQRLQQISPATMDRMRRSGRRPPTGTRGGTQPGTLLKTQIPIRTCADWDDKRPGFVEADLGHQDGGNPSGFFACTLTMTAVCTGGTELRAVPTKAQAHVFNALKDIRQVWPFTLLGLDSDNGAEFINDQLLRYCAQEPLTCTRGRVGRQHDNPYVEQKNWSVARRLVGYDRYDTHQPVSQLNALYPVYRVYTNHFLPVVKLVQQVRAGSRVTRICDEPQTPYQRVRDSPHVSEELKAKLRALHTTLDVVKLKPQIDQMIACIPASQVG